MKLILFILAIAAATSALPGQEADISARLLESLLGESKVGPSPSAPQEGMTVKIYQLAQLKVDAANGLRATDVLRRWLPPGSTVSPVPANNALHILTTPTAHQAVAELLATLDQPPAMTPAVDPRFKEAMEKFSEVSAQPQELRRLLDDSFEKLRKDWILTQAATTEIQDRHERRYIYLAAGIAAAAVLVLLGGLALSARRKPAANELALVPQHLTQAIQPLRKEVNHQLDLMAKDVKQVVEAAFQIHRQSEAQRSAELAGLKTQLEAYLNKRDAILDHSRAEMDKTATRLNASADAIQVSQVKVEALTDQLRGAMHEIDRLQAVVSDREENLQHQSELLRVKEDEVSETRSRLSRNLAKLALLAKELGVDDSFFTTPLPEFDRFVEGEAQAGSVPSTEESHSSYPEAGAFSNSITEAVAEPTGTYSSASPDTATNALPTKDKADSWPDIEFHDPSRV